jgi:gas vesicle protein
MERHTGDSGSFLFGLVIGMVSGAAAGLLYAPRSGREMRAEIADRARSGRDQLTTAAEKSVEMFKEGRQAVARSGEAIASAFNEGRAAYDRARTGEQHSDVPRANG